MVNNDKSDEYIYKGQKLPETLIGNEQAIKSWRKWVRLNEKFENHPKRWLTFQPVDGEEVMEVDLGQTWSSLSDKLGIQGSFKTAKFPKHLKHREEEIRKSFHEIRSLITQKRAARYKWDREMKAAHPRDIMNTRNTEIIRMFGSYMSIEEVQQRCKEQWNIKPNKTRLRDFFYANQEQIKAEREKKSNGYEHLPLVDLTGRVEQLAYLYETNKKKYIETDYAVSRSKELRALLEQIKTEIEGNRIMLDVSGKIDVDMTINVNESLKKVASQVPLLSFIVSLVASKAGIDYTYIMNMLQTSIYSKYTGVMGVLPKGEQQDLTILPSNEVYDWMSLKNKVYGKNKLATPLDVEDVEVEEVKGEKEKLLQLIKEKKNTL